MRRIFSIVSVISTLLGLSMIISISNSGNLYETLTFETKGTAFIVFFNLYNFLGFLFACLAERNKYRILLFICSIAMLLVSLILTFVGVYGFQEP
ncbi:hypothetical protein GCM10010954_21490 [Halobacillus andaensis]|uniref:Uncharacterized protein n=1 Tax=Halobacillus andaensis TaxID=1176239 RepID=A0A917B774_HALAA|nr:glucan phosphoethanolaminetransferase (alkaline phosphatase superfamily) [Halobacillus andaensis]GGF22360.1 hypothetical protein GCM10010954_21490 [Halobacillus andaensis]